MYEPIALEIDRNYGNGTYRSHTIKFTGRLVQIIKKEPTTMRLYEWVDRGRLVYLVHVEEEKPGQLPRHTLYPFINTHSARTTPKKGIHRGGRFSGVPEFANKLGLTPEHDSDLQ